MEIIIEGWRAGGDERKKAAGVPVDQLPPLTDEQKAVARKLGISEEAYSRSAYAGKLNQASLMEKTSKLAAILQRKVRTGVELRRIRLDVLNHRFDVVASEGSREFSFRVSEDLVDDLLQSGSEELDRNLQRVVDYALPENVARA